MNESTWQYTVQDYSPLLTYAGNNSSQVLSLNTAWSQKCPSGWWPGTRSTICDVGSIHVTSTSGASVSLNFYGGHRIRCRFHPWEGQSIDLLGFVTGGMAYDLTVDGSTLPANSSSTLLASVSNLSLGEHTIALKARPSASHSGLLFQGAVVTVGTGLTGYG